MDYMRCLFWNSALWTPFESLSRVNEREPQGVFVQNDGTWLLYGDATCLVAYPVKDLRVRREASGEVIIEWTAPASMAVEPKTGRLVRAREAVPRRYEWRQ